MCGYKNIFIYGVYMNIYIYIHYISIYYIAFIISSPSTPPNQPLLSLRKNQQNTKGSWVFRVVFNDKFLVGCDGTNHKNLKRGVDIEIIHPKTNMSHRKEKESWLVVSTPLKNISQTGNLPQVGVKIKRI